MPCRPRSVNDRRPSSESNTATLRILPQSAKDGRGMWPQYGVGLEITGGFTTWVRVPDSGRARVVNATNLRQLTVDRKREADIYTPPYGTPPLGGLACLRSSSLIFGDQASDLKSEAARLRPLSGTSRGLGPAWS